MSDFISTKEAAQILQCSQRHIYDLIDRGRLTAFKDGITRIYKESFNEYLKEFTETYARK